MVSHLISLLERIVGQFVCWIQIGIVSVINLLIAGVAAVWAMVVGVLPDMPVLELPDFLAGVFSFMGWLFPITWLLGTWLPTFLVLWAVILVIMIPLRWIKAAE